MLAAIDPGLDRAVAAIFDPPKGYQAFDFATAARWYSQNVEVATSPGLPLEVRLDILHQWARRVAGEVTLVFMEQPTIYGIYSRNRNKKKDAGIPRGLAMLYMAMGALTVGVSAHGATRFELVIKPRVPKINAHRLVTTAFRDARRSMPPGLIDDEDGMDAIFIGLWALSRAAQPSLTQQARLALR